MTWNDALIYHYGDDGCARNTDCAVCHAHIGYREHWMAPPDRMGYQDTRVYCSRRCLAVMTITEGDA